MTDWRVSGAVRDVVDVLLPKKVLRQESLIESTINDDGTIYSDAIRFAIPWQRVDIWLPGAATTGSNLARIPFPQGGVIRHVAIDTRTVPSANYQAELVAGGDAYRISLQPGERSKMYGVKISLNPTSWLTVNVINAGGAGDVTITLHYSPLPES